MFALLAAVLALAPAQALAADWPQSGWNADSSRHDPFETTIGPANASDLDLRWKVSTGGSYPRMAVAGGVLYVAAGELAAVDAKTGVQLWTSGIRPGWSNSYTAVADGAVYVGSDDRRSHDGSVTSTSSGSRWACCSAGSARRHQHVQGGDPGRR